MGKHFRMDHLDQGLLFPPSLTRALNRVNFNNPSTNIQGGSFGLVTRAGSGRAMLFGLRLDF